MEHPLYMRRARRFPHTGPDAPWTSPPSLRPHERQRINSEADGSQARDPVKGVKAKYQLAVTKEPLLSVIVEMDAYKATRAKIEAYSE